MSERVLLLKQSFKEGFRSLPRREVNIVKERIRKEFGWTKNQLMFRTYARAFMNEQQVHTLRSIFAEYNIDPFTGEYLS